MYSLAQHEWRSDTHPAERIATLERELAQAKELLKMQHELITKLREESCQQTTT